MTQKLSTIECLRMYWRMAELGPLTRRYIVIGAFDGALTIVAIILATLAGVMLFSAQVTILEVNLLIRAGLSAGVGLAISSGWGAFEAERVERKREIQHLEVQMQRSMDGCLVDSAVRFATAWASFIHGIAPLPAAVLPLIPLFLFPADFVMAGLLSVAITMSFLFLLGIWMARIMKTNPFACGLRMVFAGLITAIICVLIGAF
ncbi:MAG: VIT1/CCC1 transporter family protein [Candidatus Hodarchaeota archaeon]